MSFFGMGGMEIMVIMVVALIIFGPGKLPEIGAQVGKAVRDFRRVTNELTSEFNETTGDLRSTVEEMKGSVAQIEAETRQLAESIPASIQGTVDSATGAASQNGATKVAVTATREDPLADFDGLEDDDSEHKPTIY